MLLVWDCEMKERAVYFQVACNLILTVVRNGRLMKRPADMETPPGNTVHWIQKQLTDNPAISELENEIFELNTAKASLERGKGLLYEQIRKPSKKNSVSCCKLIFFLIIGVLRPCPLSGSSVVRLDFLFVHLFSATLHCVFSV